MTFVCQIGKDYFSLLFLLRRDRVDTSPTIRIPVTTEFTNTNVILGSLIMLPGKLNGPVKVFRIQEIVLADANNTVTVWTEQIESGNERRN